MKSGLLQGWDRLRHGGLLLDPRRLREVAAYAPEPLPSFYEWDLRKRAAAILDAGGARAADVSSFVFLVLRQVCGFSESTGRWQRGPQVPAVWGRVAITGETIKPRQLWQAACGGVLPVFMDREKRLGSGRGCKLTSQVLGWLRSGPEQLALVTNGKQWRLVFAGLDFDAWCEWDVDLWFEEGELSPQVSALRSLLQPVLWTPKQEGLPAPLLQAVLDSRKGQAELSGVLGERVREAVEILVQGHGEELKEKCAGVDPADIYRAAVRVVMRLVVVLFAESRELLPRENALYHNAYGLAGLLEELEKAAARGGGRLARCWAAWPRVLALFRLVHQGSHHPSLPVPAYGGELFAPGDALSAEGLLRALAVFENACFDREALSDRDVHRLLERITRTRVKLRQGRASTWVAAPVDFSDLSSEYIGILYEGLLDFELKTAPAGDPVVFLAVGDQPALPLSRLEAMDDHALKDLLEKLKDTSSGDDEATGEATGEGTDEEASETDEEATEGDETASEAAEEDEDRTGDKTDATGHEGEDEDERHSTRTRAETWARRAVEVGKLARKPRGPMSPEKKLAFEQMVARKARQLVTRVVLPGEWYLVRWGGTRKGSGTFYTRPGLAVPTVQRTLRPLAWNPPVGPDGSPDRDAPPVRWTPKKPEQILALKVVDPACGSGTFPVAALRFLTDALYASLHHHGRIHEQAGRALVALLEGAGEEGPAPGESLGAELLPCRPDDALFEPRLTALLRRHVVERCIYGVDLDPLAVELCRLALWIETMDRSLPFSFLDHKIKCGNALVGAWFDQFRHYPAMAFKNREGGDKGHTGGVHFEQDARTQAIKDFVKSTLTPDLVDAITGQLKLGAEPVEDPEKIHDEALAVLEELHALPVVGAAERARLYRERLLGSTSWQALKAAFDRWCACWFWPAGRLDCAPLPSRFASPSAETHAVTEQLARAKRFFHWELEFPDVFQSQSAGFHAVLGNPPWETLQPNSKEFFSSIDPLYRSYGKQEALRYQTGYFREERTERDWLSYTAGFANDSNWMKFAANPFGDPDRAGKSPDRFGLARGKANVELHTRWRDRRSAGRGYADPHHPFRHRGEGKAYTYKLFLEQAHALLRGGGRLGFIVPSGLYSDHGTGALRELFLDHCRWEWLFGFENREKIFDIDSRFKFNPIIIEKGGCTEALRTAFMRRKLEDWEHAEPLATPYTRERVERFSPRSKAILEIQSTRDLEILEKIYANSVLLGDDGPDGWGIKYAQGDFNMTSDSKLFPPRPKWEAKGYRPDEYSRWLKGDWRPIAELWAELGVDAAHPGPAEIALEAWLFDSNAGPERRAAEARRVHGHLLKPGDVARTEWHLRCAQPPYDRLPIPRAGIPAGIVLSRKADAFIREEGVRDVALPLYEGRMIGQFDFSQKAWVSGKGRSAVWGDNQWCWKTIEPQFLMSSSDFIQTTDPDGDFKVALMDVTSSTNTRTVIATTIHGVPCGHKTPTLTPDPASNSHVLALAGIVDSLLFDFGIRTRLGGNSLIWSVLAEGAIANGVMIHERELACSTAELSLGSTMFSRVWLRVPLSEDSARWRRRWRMANASRLEARSRHDAMIFALSGLTTRHVLHILDGCDFPCRHFEGASSKGFWRVDKDKDPELRHTVLTLVAFQDLQEKIDAAGGDRDAGIEAFLNQNDGEGWMLPETLCLADYGLGHDERAKEPQPVASRLGPRFYDWQLAQTPEESWRECHLHARNLLGEAGYQKLLADIDAENRGEPVRRVAESVPPAYGKRNDQGKLFE